MASYNQSAILAFKNYNAEVECIQEAFEEFYDEMDYYENQEFYGNEESEESGFSPVELTEAQEAEQQQAEWERELEEVEQAEAEWERDQSRNASAWLSAWQQAWKETGQETKEMSTIVSKPEIETAW